MHELTYGGWSKFIVLSKNKLHRYRDTGKASRGIEFGGRLNGFEI